MIRILVILLFPTLCFAGGDYSQVSIMAFEGSEAKADFTIKFVNKRKFNKNCDALKVNLNYKRVPWYSWLPFVHSSHPTFSETKKSVAFLKSKFANNETVKFGYIGGGLKGTETRARARMLTFYPTL